MGVTASSQQNHILIIGLDAAGKTTLLYKLNRKGDIVTTIPTIGFHLETVETKQGSITAWDVGGRCNVRPLWRHYWTSIQAIMFVVDANDRERLEDVKQELHRIAQEEGLQDKPILVLANKQDLPNAMTTDELAQKLTLGEVPSLTQWHVMPACATRGQGLQEAFDWIDDALHPKPGLGLAKPHKPLLSSIFRSWLRW